MKLDPIAHPERRSRARFALRLTLLLALSAALAFTGSLRAAKTVEYTIIDLGDLGDPNPAQAQSEAYAINIHNQVVGAATTASGDTHAFLYSGGQMIDLGTLTTPLGINGQTWAYGINDQGVVVGTSNNSQGGVDAFYDETSVPGAQMVYINPPPGTQRGSALGINNQNVIGGGCIQGGLGGRAFIYRIGGASELLPAISEGLYTKGIIPAVAYAVSSGGIFVGDGLNTADDQLVAITSFNNGGALLPLEAARAYAINSSGIIVGIVGGSGVIQIVGTVPGGSQAAQWTPGSTNGPTALGYLPSTGTPVSAALGINDAGQIVGYSDVASATHHAIIYQNGQMTDLNNVIAPGQNGGFLTLSMATAINDSGAIAGYGLRTAGGSYFAFLAIPSIPTPTVTASTANLAAKATKIVINGTGFDTQIGNDTVAFNDGAVGTVTAATSTSLTVTFTTKPAAAGSLTAVVTTDGYTSGSPVQVATVTK